VAEAVPRTLLCLGNPGAEYFGTRHNVGWWLADRVAAVHDLGRFRQEGAAAVARGRIAGELVQVVKPLTYMNRSGRVAEAVARRAGFELARDLLVVVDDVALDPGRVRLRPGGSAGGHNGLKSVQASLGTTEYARLRIGVGAPPPGAVRSDWVLSAPGRADREAILERFDDLVGCVEVWVAEGTERAMNRCNA
jgi:peptidyl-tRNA hydrolase, PTH1 family